MGQYSDFVSFIFVSLVAGECQFVSEKSEKREYLPEEFARCGLLAGREDWGLEVVNDYHPVAATHADESRPARASVA